MQATPISAIADAGKVRLGAGCRRLAVAPAAPQAASPATTPATPPAAIADSGKVRLGAGCRR